MSSPIGGALAKDRLGVPSVIFFVMSAAAPLTVIAGVITIGYLQTGNTSLPLAYIIVPVILAIFSIGYVAMSRHISNAGAFYTYITHGLGKPLGVGGAWMALLAYLGLLVGLFGVIGSAAIGPLNHFFGTTLDPATDWYWIALILWLVVGILGLLRVDINGKVLAVLLTAEIVIVLIYDFFYVSEPGPAGVTVDSFSPGTLFGAEGGMPAVGAILVLAFLGFVGFEASVVFSEESKNPKRTIALATFLSLGIIGAVYALTSWAMTVATGSDNLVGAIVTQDAANPDQVDPTQFIFFLARDRGQNFLADAGTVLFVTSVVAATISFHNTVARYTFALGREGVFPGALGSTGRRSGAPIGGSILATIVSLVSIVLILVFDRDPLTELFFMGGNGGAVGILALVTLTSLAVLVFFLKNGRGENVFARIIAPVLAFVLLAPILYYAVDGFGGLIGNEGAVSWIIPAAYPVVGVLGILYALVLKKARPDVYQAIGLGANSSTGLTTQSKVSETAGV